MGKLQLNFSSLVPTQRSQENVDYSKNQKIKSPVDCIFSQRLPPQLRCHRRRRKSPKLPFRPSNSSQNKTRPIPGSTKRLRSPSSRTATGSISSDPIRNRFILSTITNSLTVDPRSGPFVDKIMSEETGWWILIRFEEERA